MTNRFLYRIRPQQTGTVDIQAAKTGYTAQAMNCCVSYGIMENGRAGNLRHRTRLDRRLLHRRPPRALWNLLWQLAANLKGDDRMKTVWGEQLNPDSVLQEYPRPQLVRESYENLNGLWTTPLQRRTRNPMPGTERFSFRFLPKRSFAPALEKPCRPGSFSGTAGHSPFPRFRRGIGCFCTSARAISARKSSATGSMSWSMSAATPRFHLTSRRLSTQETTN